VKRIGSFLLAAGVLLGSGIGVAATEPSATTDISLSLNGIKQTYDRAPVQINDRVLVPMRSLLESMDVQVTWDEPTQTVTAAKGGHVTRLTIGSTVAERNGQTYQLDVAPQVIDDRTMVPVRFLAESFGFDVKWIEDKRMVKICTVGCGAYPSEPPMLIDTRKEYTAVLDTDKGVIKIKLFDNEAPKTVNNFVFLARDNFYDGVKFHRIIQNFVIQTGDPTGTGHGGPGYQFADELPPVKPYAKGIVAMANAGKNTNGSQFFIGSGDQVEFLNESPFYTVFGEVTEGLDIVTAIAATPVQANRYGEPSQPVNDIHIKTITIEEK
jgi:cyclophilin family peptidyl-prolyl cis-trans isomerase